MKNKKPKIGKTVQGLLKNPTVVKRDLKIQPSLLMNGRYFRQRLSWSVSSKCPIDYVGFAKGIRQSASPTAAFYVDTNIFTGEEKPDVFWQALLEKESVVTPFVWEELQPWLGNPFRNQQMRYALLDARLSRPHSIRFDAAKGWSHNQLIAGLHYIDLLAVRKRFGRYIADDFKHSHGREPTDEEFNRLVQTNAGEHELTLVRKGWKDVEKNNFFADEQLVVCAVFDAIINRREVTILTTDTDVLEQFAKLVKMLDVHYQATLFADKFAEDPTAFESQQLARNSPELRHYFADDTGKLVRKPCEPGRPFVEWLLPKEFLTTPVYCVLFGGEKSNLTFTPIDYTAEDGMAKLLEAKGKTRGFCTDRLSGHNCHVSGFPAGVEDPRHWVVLAKDNVETVAYMNYPLLDIAHANYEKV